MSDTLQIYYLVTGTHKITGRETSLYIPAGTEGAALERAAVEGIEVESIRLEQPEVDTQEPKAAKPPQFTIRSLMILTAVIADFLAVVRQAPLEYTLIVSVAFIHVLLSSHKSIIWFGRASQLSTIRFSTAIFCH